ncbi:hypothetical protein ABZ372_54140, partial [Streptomyces sp. NPDC005921]
MIERTPSRIREPAATARRLALELVEAGALERAADGGFTVGIRLWQLGWCGSAGSCTAAVGLAGYASRR